MNRYLFFGLVSAGLLLRVAMLTHNGLVNGGEVDVYLADEGLVGLMGKHILEGRSLPVFFYGQHYLGALEAYGAAASFSLFGMTFPTLRLVTLAFSIALGVLVYRFTYRRYSVAAARWATALVAVAPAYFLQWNIKARGGFVEHLVLLFVIMLAFWRYFLDHRRERALAFVLGLACGVALWVNQLVLAYVLLMAGLLALKIQDRRGWPELVVGTLVGASLLIGYNVVHPLATVKTLARKAIVLNRVPPAERQDSWVARGVAKRFEALRHGIDKAGLVFGVPPSAEAERMGMSDSARAGGSLAPLRRRLGWLPLLVFGAGLLAAVPRRGPAGWEAFGSDQLLGLFTLVTLAVGYVSARYMLAAYPLAAVLTGVLVSRSSGLRRTIFQGAVGLLLLFNLASWTDAWELARDPLERRSEDLLSFLEDRRMTACYTAGPLYHVVFASGERVILAPLQNDRYPAYNAMVEASDALCYVFRDDQQRKRQHKAFMRLLEEQRVTYAKGRAGDVYNVLYDFSPRAAITGSAIEAVRNQEQAEPRLTDLVGPD